MGDNGDEFDAERELDIVEVTSQLTDEFERYYMVGVRDISWHEFIESTLTYVEKVCLVRQHEAIRASLKLAGDGLGHLAVAYVRPAYEEYLWIAYLNSIDGSLAKQLLLALNMAETASSITAQRGYFGDHKMAEFGWPDGYLVNNDAVSQDAEDSIDKLAAELGWPKNRVKGHPPSTKWIASKTGRSGLYDFLYSASSRMLHFSPQEIMRRGWGDASGISLDSPAYIGYRLHFALYWLVYLLIHTFTVLKSATDQEVREPDKFGYLVKKFGSHLGQGPIIPSNIHEATGARSVLLIC